VDIATGEVELDEKDEARAAGGRKGGASSADRLTAEERSAIAKKAAPRSLTQIAELLDQVPSLDRCA
jgi:hypothetical protein